MAKILERSVKGIGSNILGQIIMIGSGLIIVPVFLKYWGSVTYGEWLALSAAISYFALLDFGFQTYVVNRMTQAHARGSLYDLHYDLHSTLRVICVIVGVGIIALIAVVGLLRLDIILNLSETSRLKASLVFLFLGCNTLLVSIPMGLVAGLYRATGAYARGQMIANIMRIFLLLLTIAIVWRGFSMPVLAFSTLLFTLCGASLNVWLLHRYRPDIKIGFKMGNIAHGWSLFLPSLLFLLMAIAGTLSIQGTVLVLSAFLGGAAVAQFNTTRTLSNFIIQLSTVVNSAMWPEITLMEAQGNTKNLWRISKMMIKLNLFSAMSAAMFLRFLGPGFYRIWTGRQLLFNEHLLSIFLIQVILMAFWNSSGVLLMATNNHKVYAWLSVASAVTTIILALFFVRIWGVVGVALAGLMADTIFCLCLVPKIACLKLGESLLSLLRSTVLPGVAIGTGIFVTFELLRPIFDTQFLKLLFSLICMMGLYSILSYKLWLNHEERTVLLQLPRRIFGFVTR